MTDNIYAFFISLLRGTNSFTSEQEANEFVQNYAKEKYTKGSDILNFVRKFKVVPKKEGFEIKPKITAPSNIEIPVEEIETFIKKGNYYDHRVLKREVPISKFKLTPYKSLSNQAIEIINNIANQIVKEKRLPLIVVKDNKIIQGQYAIYALNQLGYKKTFILVLKERGKTNLKESLAVVPAKLKNLIELNLSTYLSILQDRIYESSKDKEEFSKSILTDIGYIIKHNHPSLNVFLETENSAGESYQLYITNWKDVVYMYLPYLQQYHQNYKVSGDDIAIIKMDRPDLLFFDSLGENIGEYEQLTEGYMRQMTGYKKQLYDFIVSLNSKFVEAAQKIYDEWEQNEEGVDEILGTGGICQDIAEEMCNVFNRENHNVKFSCYSSGENYDFHVVMYVYFDPEFLEGNEDDEDNKILFEVDIPYENYETGGGFTWKKKPNVQFNDNMISVYDLSEYYNNYIQKNDE